MFFLKVCYSFVIMLFLCSGALHAASCTDTKVALNTVAFPRLSDVKGRANGYYKFNFGSGDFLAYHEDDWVLMLSYHSGTNSDPGITFC